MRSFAIVSLSLAAIATAQSTTTQEPVLPDNPNTKFLTQTDSNGVITGQATVAPAVTTQPAVVTSQPIVASIPAGLTDGLNTVIVGNQTLTASVSGSLTSVIKSTPKPTNAAATSGGAAASASASGSGSASASGSGAAGHVKAGVGALLGAAGLFALFL